MIPPLITNKLTAANFYVMIQNYRKMGYKDGFSAAGVSFDYRRYIHSNKFFENSLIYEINRLYRNTGKKVVIITHSLGGLLVLGNLLRMREDIKNKVKSFVPIVPPFAGASHLLEAYLYGLTDFNTEIKIGNFFDFKVILLNSRKVCILVMLQSLLN
jgi:alpha-beta hydrolase superfamily lysophospholipase